MRCLGDQREQMMKERNFLGFGATTRQIGIAQDGC